MHNAIIETIVVTSYSALNMQSKEIVEGLDDIYSDLSVAIFIDGNMELSHIPSAKPAASPRQGR